MTVRVTTTVTVAAGSYDLVTLANLKIDLGISDTSDDIYLARAISRASAAVAQYCNRVFPRETVQDVFDLTFPRLQWAGEQALQASRWPVGTITSVVEDGTTLVKDTDYRVDIVSGEFLRLDSNGEITTWTATPVTIIYQGGFATIPLDLQGAASSVVSALKFNKTRDPMLRSENILSGLYAYTLFDPNSFPAGTAEQVGLVLDNYRVPVAA